MTANQRVTEYLEQLQLPFDNEYELALNIESMDGD